MLLGDTFSLAAGGTAQGRRGFLLARMAPRRPAPNLCVEALVSDLSHPAWCAAAYCTVDRPPVRGHGVGVHRSVAQVVEATVVRLQQPRSASGPSLEIRRGDAVLVLPLAEAQSLAPAIDDLLEASGVAL